MVSQILDLLDGGSPPPAVRRPVFELTLGSADASDWANAVLSLVVETYLAPAVDVVTVYASGRSDAPSVAAGDKAVLSLGYEDSGAEVVFSGRVESVRRTIHGITRIALVNAAAVLTRLKLNQSFEDQAAGAIVKDLAGRASVSSATIEDGINFPFYAIDDRSSAYQQIAALAVRCGFLASVKPDGSLAFLPFAAGQPAQSFTYGRDILRIDLAAADPLAAAVTMVGEGAAGSQGKDSWSWLVKDPASVTVTAGSGEPKLARQDASLRSSDAAKTAAGGLSGQLGRANEAGTMLVPGAPLVVSGSTIEITGSPVDALNGTSLVCGVRHRYSKQAGFTTLIGLSKSGATTGGSLLDVLGGLL